MPPRFGPTSPLPDRVLARLMASLLYEWDSSFTSRINRSEVALRYLKYRGLDLDVQRTLVEGDFWVATQDTIRYRGEEWLGFDKERLSQAEAAFSNVAGVRDFKDWDTLERDDMRSKEGFAMWDSLHAEQKKAWGNDKTLLHDHRHIVRLYPDLPFKSASVWRKLDGLAEMRYVFERKQVVLHAAKGSPSDFREAHFRRLSTYPEIAQQIRREYPGASNAELRQRAWCTYRTHRAPAPKKSDFMDNMGKAIKNLPPHPSKAY